MLDYKDFSTESSLNNKRKVVAFVKEWCNTAKDAFYEDPIITQFLQDLSNIIGLDCKVNSVLREELKTIEMVIESDPYV